MWDSFLDGFGALLGFFYDIIPNYGVAIVLLTVAIRLLLFPLTSKQARSMAEMQRVQPEIKKIQQKYKHDRQKLNEELMAFYKEHKINPLAGCLPLVAQFPIFIALFQVLRSPASHIPDGTSLFEAFCPPQAIDQAGDCDPVGLEFLTMDLSRGANASHSGLLEALPFFVLILFVVGTGYLQSRQMTRMQRGGQKSAQAQMMTKIFPVFFGVISYTLPAGVVVYFLVSNIWQIGQQQMIFGRSDDHSETVGKGSGKAAKTAKTQDSEPAPEPVDARSREEVPEAGADEGATPESGASGNSGNSGKPSRSHQQRSKSRKRKKRKKRR